ncbi:MAG: hypothetical protein Kow0077_15260 [Anaerolineae bacterium]
MKTHTTRQFGLLALGMALLLILSGCNLPIAGNVTATPAAPTMPPQDTATPVSEAARIEAAGWLGLVTETSANSPFDDYLFLLSEGAGSIGVAGADDAIAAQIAALRQNNTRAHFWGTVYCDVPDYNGCQFQVDQLLADGNGPSDPTPVEGWQGKLYSTSEGAQFDDYFVLAGDFPIRYGIAVPPEQDQEGAFSATLASYRDTEALLSISGDLVCGVPDVNGCQIRVSELQVLAPGSGTPQPPVTESAPQGETVEDWVGTLVRNGAGAPYTYAFQVWEGMRRIGVTSIDGSIQQQIIAVAGEPTPRKVHIWGTLYANAPENPDDDVIYVTAIEVEAPTAAPQQPTATPVVIACTLPPRLQIGNAGRVAPGPLPNAMRSAPGTGNQSVVLGNIPGGTIFTVLNGPICASGYNWWQVDAGGFIGWTAEGQDGEYWLDPLSCGSGLPIRLVPGEQGRVTLDPPLDNIVRSQPGRGAGALIGEIPPGGIFTVLEGPQCGTEGMAWWRVDYNGLVGWTAEGENGVYWLEPYDGPDTFEVVSDLLGTIHATGVAQPSSGADDYFELASTSGATERYGIASTDPVIAQQIMALRDTGTQVRIWGQLRRDVPDFNTMQINVTQLVVHNVAPTPECVLPPRLVPGTSGAVTPGLPNVVRTAPGTSDSATVQGRMAGGTIFRVLEGPVCADGYNWWRVTTGSLTGWTAEGASSEYWLSPVVCGNGLLSRMVPGMQGRVTFDPPFDNTVRSEPRGTGTLLGEIPPGGTFTVLAGPQCGPEGKTWWQVNYNGLVGWTAEGIPGEYWLEPIS